MRRLLYIGATAAIFIWLGFTLLSTPQPQINNQAVLYSTETLDDLQLVFKQAIDVAKDSITLIIYSLRDKKIIRALKQAANRGVKVTIICDVHASSGISKKLDSVTYRVGKGLMHQKILAIDGEKVWIGSANMTLASLKMHGNLVLGVFQKELASFIEEKALMMTQAGLVSNLPHRTFDLENQSLEMWFFPDNKNGPEKIKQLIRTAQKTIKIAMFTWTRFDLADALLSAKNRGVKVEVVLDRSAAQGVSLKIADKLRNGGIEVRLSQGQELLHHKFMIIDDRTLLNGSANWTLAAFSQNDDCFTILSPLNEPQQKFLNRMWEEIIADSQ